MTFHDDQKGAVLRLDLANALNSIALTTNHPVALETLCVVAVALGLTVRNTEPWVQIDKPR